MRRATTSRGSTTRRAESVPDRAWWRTLRVLAARSDDLRLRALAWIHRLPELFPFLRPSGRELSPDMHMLVYVHVP